MAFDCHEGNASVPLLYDLSTGRFHPPSGADQLSPAPSANSEYYSTFKIGARIFAIRALGNRVDEVRYFDWQAGRFVVPALASTSVVSLDTESATRRLCDPVRAERRADSGFEDAITTGAFVVRWRLNQAWLQRCGAPKSTLLTRDLKREPILTSTYVAWTTRSYAFLRVFAQAKTYRLSLPRGSGCCGAILAGTKHRLFMTAKSVSVIRVPGT
jgi:hypothetical protein